MRPKHYSDDRIEKMYYGLLEVAKILNESKDCIRFWSNEFLHKVGRRSGNWRIFDRKSVAKLHHIKQMIRQEKLKYWQVRDRLKLMIRLKII